MKKLKQLCAISLAALMAGTGFGCSKPQSNSAAPSSPASSEAASSEAPKNPQDKYQPIDMGGRKFVFAYNWDMVPAKSSDTLDPKTANDEQIGKLENLKRVEKKYNCKIEYINVPYNEISQKLTTSVMAGEPYADGVNLSPDQVYPAILGNTILPLKEATPENSDIFHDQNVLKPAKYLGDDYVMVEKNVTTTGKFLGFNRDIIKKLGMEAPDALYKKGEWNWDNFEKLAKAATKDTNGDGKIDQWGLAGTPGRLAPLFVASNDGYLLDETNKKSGLDDAKTVAAFEFMNKLYNTDKVCYIKDNNPDDYDGNDNSFKDGKSAMFYLENWMLPTADPKLSFEVGCAPMPAGPSNQKGTMYFSSDSGVVIPKGVKNPKWVYQVFEELIDWYGEDYSRKSDGTTQWLETLWPTEEDVKMSIDVAEKGAKTDYYNCIPEFPIGDVVGGFLKKGQTAAQAVEANKQIAQDKVDAVFKK